MINQEDYLKAAKQDTRRLGDVARVCRDYVTAMRAVVAVAVAVAEVAGVAGVAGVAAVAVAGAGAVEREHPSDD